MVRRSGTRSPGRPREFDEDDVLERALEVFWRQGYEGTSLDDLLDATGMARQSLYRVFGNKHEVFLRALERYGSTRMKSVREHLLESPSPRAALHELLDMWERRAAAPDFIGCLVMNSLTEFACQTDEDVQTCTQAELDALQKTLIATLKRAEELGELSLARPPREIAHRFVGVVVAVTHLGRSGAKRSILRSVVDGARELLTV